MYDLIETAGFWHSGQTSDLYMLSCNGRLLSVEHAQNCLSDFERCRHVVNDAPSHYDHDDIERLDSAIDDVMQYLSDNGA